MKKINSKSGGESDLLKILVIDPFPMSRAVLCKKIRNREPDASITETDDVDHLSQTIQKESPDIVFVDIPEDLEEISSGDSFGTIEAVKTVSDLYAPCNGKVIEINQKLADEPQLVNSDPYGEGWLIKIEISDTSQLNELLDAEAYKNQIGQ